MVQSKKPDWFRTTQLPPASVPADTPRPVPVLFDAEHRPITTLEGWVRRRVELRRAWRAFLGVIPGPLPVNTLKVINEDRVDGVIRQLVTYESERDLPVEAYVLRPAGPGRGRPGAVVFHSTAAWTIRQPAGLEGPEEKHIGLHLARRGYVTFCPRNFIWQYGRPEKLELAVDWLRQRHPGVTGMAKMLFDARRAVDLLRRSILTSIRAGLEQSAIPWEPRRFSIWPRLTSAFAHRYQARVESVWVSRTGTHRGISARRSGALASRSTTRRCSPCARPAPFS